jgi:hypothetical protein
MGLFWFLVLLAVIVGVISVAVFFFIPGSPMSYVGFILTVILIALAMSVQISESSWDEPDVSVKLADSAKEIIMTNKGNAPAVNVHVLLVPVDIEFKAQFLKVEEVTRFPIGQMVEQVKAVISFENERGMHYQKTSMLTALGPDEDDILKPMFPLFKWKPGP